MPRLWQHRNGVFYVRWREDGKGRRKSLGTTQEHKAKRRFNNFLRDLIAGKIKPISGGQRKISFYEFTDEYLDHMDRGRTHSTYVLSKTALEKAKSCWGDIPLGHISVRQIDRLVQDMKNAGLSEPTINKNCRHVKAALSKAHEWEYINTPVRFPKPLKEEKQIRFLSVKQLRSLMASIVDPEFADYCMFSAYSGLRSGEILRLKWDDVDNPEGFLHIVSEQKNKDDSRIPINTHMRKIITRCKRRRKGQRTLFRFNTLTWISQKFKHYARKAGIDQCRFHDLRHTFASHLTMGGEDLRAIQELMRHKNIASTMVYANVSPAHLKKISESLNYGPMPVGKKGRKRKRE